MGVKDLVVRKHGYAGWIVPAAPGYRRPWPWSPYCTCQGGQQGGQQEGGHLGRTSLFPPPIPATSAPCPPCPSLPRIFQLGGQIQEKISKCWTSQISEGARPGHSELSTTPHTILQHSEAP